MQKIYGLVGKSLTHSFSKTYFEAKFQKQTIIDCHYFNFELNTIADLRKLIKEKTILGLNVTMPYKESVIPFIDELDLISKECGAVNCIKVYQTTYGNVTLKGFNTDVYGFSQSVKPFLEPKHNKALILGTGGASKAIAYALTKIGVETFFVTTKEKTQVNMFHYSELNNYIIQAFTCIVNTTPLGMYPNIDDCPNIPYEYITKDHLLFDAIYNPQETLFLKHGKQQGAITINGLSMLQLQAEKSWQIWNNL